jgi:hypothetical protein
MRRYPRLAARTGQVVFNGPRITVIARARQPAVRLAGGYALAGRPWFSGGTVSFSRARFSGATIDLTDVADWSSPPTFSEANVPPGVKLPKLA